MPVATRKPVSGACKGPYETMTENNARSVLLDAQSKGPLSTLGAFVRLSGPGWLLSAITLGGGSLGGALYLGMLGGNHMLWLQLVAIVIGVVMLSAIGFVTLSTGRRPYEAINEYVNPVLGVGWVVATILANMIWILPQFSLCFDSLDSALSGSALSESGNVGKGAVSGVLAALALLMVWLSFNPGRAAQVFDLLLKLMVGFVVACFVGVVVVLAMNGNLDWNAIAAGFIPDFTQWTTTSPDLESSLGEMDDAHRAYWNSQIIKNQQNSMIGVTATAVGLNMTFLLPYSMLARKWDRPFRGLANFDLITGTAIPYLVVTSCIVIASAHAFHAKADDQFLADDQASLVESPLFKSSLSIIQQRWEFDRRQAAIEQFELMSTSRKKAATAEWGEYQSSAGDLASDSETQASNTRLRDLWVDQEIKPELKRFADQSKDDQEAELAEFAVSLPTEERIAAATLIKPNAKQLAASLVPLLGKQGADLVFGLGALAMGFSTIIILMLINSYAVAEVAGNFDSRLWRMVGAVAAVAVGSCWWLIWSDQNSKTWLIIVASTFGAILLPIAYVSFFLLMNNKRLLGDDKPRGFALGGLEYSTADRRGRCNSSGSRWDLDSIAKTGNWQFCGWWAGRVPSAGVDWVFSEAPPQ